MYPQLQPSQKQAVLRELVGKYLDKLNYQYAASHVRRIIDPSLVADILINRPLYAADWQDIYELLMKSSKCAEVLAHFENTDAPFWFVYGLLLEPERDKAAQQVRSQFRRCFPVYTEQVLGAVATTIRHNARIETTKDPTRTLDGAIFSEACGFAYEIRAQLMRAAKTTECIYLAR